MTPPDYQLSAHARHNELAIRALNCLDKFASMGFNDSNINILIIRDIREWPQVASVIPVEKEDVVKLCSLLALLPLRKRRTTSIWVCKQITTLWSKLPTPSHFPLYQTHVWSSMAMIAHAVIIPKCHDAQVTPT